MRRFALVLVGLVLTLPALGAERFDRGLLWRVEAPGTAPSYLFGTLHHDDERVLALSPKVRRAFAGARTYALEMLEDEPAVRRFRAAMVTRAPELPELLGADAFQRLDAILAERGVPREARPRLKPWAALLVLLRPADGPMIILDKLLALEAEKQGKRLVPLETVEEQIDAVDGLPADSQLALLRAVEADYDRIRGAFRPMVSAYLEGDLAALWRINAQAMGDDPGLAVHNGRFLERLLFERNRRFADRLAPLLRQGRVFAAFGAMHLYGERGVLALLAQHGFRVRRAD